MQDRYLSKDYGWVGGEDRNNFTATYDEFKI